VSSTEVSLAGRPVRPRERGWSKWGLAVAVLGLALCLGSCTLSGIVIARGGQLRARGGPVGLVFGTGVMDICAGVVTQPRLQIGVGWQSPIMSRTPPAVMFSVYAFCVGTPGWPPGVPPRGEWMFPP
jgi:hypothetical protein